MQYNAMRYYAKDGAGIKQTCRHYYFSIDCSLTVFYFRVFFSVSVLVMVTNEQIPLQTGVAAGASVDVRVKLSDHPQSFLVRIDLVGVVPELTYLLIRVTHDARTRPVTLRCQADT